MSKRKILEPAVNLSILILVPCIDIKQLKTCIQKHGTSKKNFQENCLNTYIIFIGANAALDIHALACVFATESVSALLVVR